MSDSHDQVADDEGLLDAMLSDLAGVAQLYQPTNYWDYYAGILVPELRSQGLRDFRNRRGSKLVSFGASEPRERFRDVSLEGIRFLNNKFSKRLPFWSNLLKSANGILNKTLDNLPANTICRTSIDDIYAMAFEQAHAVGMRRGSKPLSDIESSRLGHPGAGFEVDGKFYTPNFLRYYLRYTYCSQHMDFSGRKVISELASGYGGQAEVLKKLHKDLTILLFDLPPQLYVCEMYLKSVFPDDVVSFRRTREMTSLENLKKGKIYIFCNWQFPLLADIPVDLFTSAISLDEIDRPEALNYLRIASTRAENVYLAQNIGNVTLAAAPGKPGVLERVVWQDYENSLMENFDILAKSPLLNPGKPVSSYDPLNPHLEAFWRRKTEHQVF